MFLICITQGWLTAVTEDSEVVNGPSTVEAYFLLIQADPDGYELARWWQWGGSLPRGYSGIQVGGGSAIFSVWFPGSPWVSSSIVQKRNNIELDTWVAL